MKTKIQFSVFLLILLFQNLIQAQELPKWRVSVGANAVDMLAPNSFSEVLKDYAGCKDHDANFYAEPLKVSLGKPINAYLTAQFSFSANIIKKDANWTEGKPSTNDQFFYLDGKMLYDLNNAFGNTGKFDPYVGLGLGYAKTHKYDLKGNAGLGFNLWMKPTWGFNVETTVNHNFKGKEMNAKSSNFFQHSIGLVFNVMPPEEKDRDHDGIADKEDQCPDEFGVISRQGCPEPPQVLDTDADGVMDPEDKCPTVAGLKTNFGCPMTDKDGDGVTDDKDQCPNEKGVISNMGCPEKPIETKVTAQDMEAEKIAQLKNELNQIVVYFDFDSDEIRADQYPKLDKAIELLKQLPNVNVQLDGHADKSGLANYNESLSVKRANKVLAYFKKYGMDASKITIKGYGDTHPVSEEREPNRRVEIKTY